MPVVEQTALGTVTPSIVSSGSCRCRGGLKSFCLTDGRLVRSEMELHSGSTAENQRPSLLLIHFLVRFNRMLLGIRGVSGETLQSGKNRPPYLIDEQINFPRGKSEAGDVPAGSAAVFTSNLQRHRKTS